jgi:hypothetical protein
MDLVQLEHFLAVADERTFTRAAERVFRTQPALSQSIKKLETELGTSLFVRDNGDVSLTEAGRILEDYAHRMLKLRDDASRSITQLQNLETGRLSVAAHESAALYLLPNAILQFLQLFPDVKVKAACERDGFESILTALTYSSEDEAAGKPNPSPIVIQGDSIRAGLRHLRGALLRYKRFLLKEQEGASWPELKVMRGVFLERCQDFEDFDQKDGAYFDIERSYKDVLIQDAANILATVDSAQLPEVGRAFLDLMSPKRSNFVGWRTFAAIEADDVTFATISRDLAEMLLSKQEIEVSVANCCSPN